jgi:hypothetical protein
MAACKNCEEKNEAAAYTRVHKIRRFVTSERTEPHTSEVVLPFEYEVFSSTESSAARARFGIGLTHHNIVFFLCLPFCREGGGGSPFLTS